MFVAAIPLLERKKREVKVEGETRGTALELTVRMLNFGGGRRRRDTGASKHSCLLDLRGKTGVRCNLI